MKQNNELQLTLLGKPIVVFNAIPLQFTRRRTLALLAYLALTGRPHLRSALAGRLTGDDTSEQQARQHLNNALRDLTLLRPFLNLDAQQVWLPESPQVKLDVQAFTDAVERGRCQNDMDALEAAVELYRGDLLEGFALRDAPNFEEWLLIEQQRLHHLLLEALELLAKLALAQNRPTQGIAAARRLLALEPWREQTHRTLMLLLARSDRVAEALVQYETCRQVLADELSLEPTPETTALYERLRQPAVLPHNLPTWQRPLLGRTAALAQLECWLATPEYRLITLLGLGGNGKTALALAAAANLLNPATPDLESPFPDGIFLVALVENDTPFDGEYTPQTLANVIGQALGLSFRSGVDVTWQLVAAMRSRRMLLLLDNAEYLGAGSGLLRTLLEHAPGLTLLATSRLPLRLAQEHVLDVTGLELPLTASEIEHAPASRLFLAAARQNQTSYAPSPAEQAAIVQLCALLGGQPLALVLAASWLGTLSARQVVDELAIGIDLLQNQHADLPPRLRNIEQVLAWSWQHVQPETQQVLRQASVFQSSFDLPAARAILGASAAQLQELREAALLQRDAQGRFQLHGLVRQYAAVQLAQVPGEAALVYARFASFYATWFARQQLDSVVTVDNTELVIQEQHHVLAAWQWAAQQCRIDLLQVMFPGLLVWMSMRGLFERGVEVFGEAIAQLTLPDSSALDREGRRLLTGELLCGRVFLLTRLGRYDEAVQEHAQAAEIVASLGSKNVMALLVYNQGELDRARTSYDDAREAFTLCLHLAQEANHNGLMVDALLALGQVLITIGDCAEAGRRLDRALHLSRAHNDQRRLALGLARRGEVLESQGSSVEGKLMFETSLELSRRLDYKLAQIAAIAALGRIARQQGDYRAAHAYWQEGLAAARAIGDVYSIVYFLSLCCEFPLPEQTTAQTEAYVAEILELRQLIGDRAGAELLLQTLASAASYSGDFATARGYAQARVDILRELGDRRTLAGALNLLGLCHVALSEHGTARTVLTEALHLAQEINSAATQGFVLNNLGILAFTIGRLAESYLHVRTATQMLWEHGERVSLAGSLLLLASLALAAAEPDRSLLRYAARLLGAMANLPPIVAMRPPYSQRYAATVATAQEHLGQAAFASDHAAGMALPLQAAVQLALSLKLNGETEHVVCFRLEGRMRGD